MGEMIGRYKITKDFSNQDAGMSRWAYCEKDGQSYFIKEFFEPKYPDDGAFSPEIVKKIRAEANEEYLRKQHFYNALAKCNSGNNIIVQDYFRYKTKYYAVSELVAAEKITPLEISRLSSDVKETIIKVVLYNIMMLHERKLVHSDLKPDNIMLKKTLHGNYTAKIVDFDSGFELDSPPKEPEDLVGDYAYYSPEAIQFFSGEKISLTEKIDVFSLGIIIHQFWCGELPRIPPGEDNIAIAVLDDCIPELSKALPPKIQTMITGMLQKKPEARPSVREVFEILSGTRVQEKKPPIIDNSVWKVATF